MGKYSREFKALGDDIRGSVSEVGRLVTFFIDQRLVLQTPVDTGEARGSWQVSYNAPIVTDNNVQDRSGALQIQTAKAIIEGGKRIQYPTLYIRSNKPYMERLNNGWSEQAPINFVDRAIVQGINDSQSITL